MSNERFAVIVSRDPGCPTDWTYSKVRTFNEAKRDALNGLSQQNARVATILAVYGEQDRVVGAYEMRGSSSLHAMFENKVQA